MAVLQIPTAIYDYLLYYECANKDWKNKNAKHQIGDKPAGFLIDSVNWFTTSSTHVGDSGGATKCGITHVTWKSFYNKYSKKYGLICGPHIDKMDKKGWMSYIQNSWNSGPGYAANVACAIVIFQCKWGGWSEVGDCLTKVRQNADIESYVFTDSGDNYKKLADATNAYSNPMKAYKIIRDEHIKYLYDISAPGKKNAQFRTGWMRREVPTFQNDGLYVEPGLNEFRNTNNFTIEQWENLCLQLKGQHPKYVKIYNWETPLDDSSVSADTYDISSCYKGKSEQHNNIVNYFEPGAFSKKYDIYTGVLLGPYMNQK